MIRETVSSWTELKPALRTTASRKAFVAHARALARAHNNASGNEAFEQGRGPLIESVTSPDPSERQTLTAAGLVLADLAMQGWQLRVRRRRVEVRPPAQIIGDRLGEKGRIRRQELVRRNSQLRTAPVRKFIRSMESVRVFNGRLTSVFSLLRDGRELAESLRSLYRPNGSACLDMLASVVDPYLAFVESEDNTCPFTGLRLMDIWRYFRHTWTNQYTSVPGRTMMFLVRDRAAPFHPIVGIGALSSPVMQIRERDSWIGWHTDTFLARVKTKPTPELARWLVEVADAAITELYVVDFLEDGLLTLRDLDKPSARVIDRLFQESAEQRRLHHRYVRSRDHKGTRADGPGTEYWVMRARTHLFRSKRALALASYLRARAIVKQAFGERPTADTLAALASTRHGSDAIHTFLKKAKADRLGIAVADITVCGAVQPYNSILGGKLVAMLAASPEVVLEYRRRYSETASEIASAIAGRAIVRRPTLVLLGTTSLYGVGSSQYNRIKIPCDRLGGSHDESLRYEELGHSKAFGTSQYSEDTVNALTHLVQQSANGQRVNSIFGEGVSPKLRKIRQGLDLLGLPSDLLLQHHRQRVVYAVSLVRNLCDHLLGVEQDPRYLFPVEHGPAATARIAGWWRERWLRNRIGSDDVLREVARHTLIRPIRHGGRVEMPSLADEQFVFADSF